MHLIKSVLIDPEEGHIAGWVRRAGGTVIEIDSSKEPMLNLLEIDVEEDPETGPRINILDKVVKYVYIGLVADETMGVRPFNSRRNSTMKSYPGISTKLSALRQYHEDYMKIIRYIIYIWS